MLGPECALSENDVTTSPLQTEELLPKEILNRFNFEEEEEELFTFIASKGVDSPIANEHSLESHNRWNTSPKALSTSSDRGSKRVFAEAFFSENREANQKLLTSRQNDDDSNYRFKPIRPPKKARCDTPLPLPSHRLAAKRPACHHSLSLGARLHTRPDSVGLNMSELSISELSVESSEETKLRLF